MGSNARPGFVFRDLVSGIIKRAIYKEYDMATELGKGSFATVYKALHMKSGEWVAVKVIHEVSDPALSYVTSAEQALDQAPRSITNDSIRGCSGRPQQDLQS